MQPPTKAPRTTGLNATTLLIKLIYVEIYPVEKWPPDFRVFSNKLRDQGE